MQQPFLNNFEPGFRLYIHDTHAVSYVSSEILVVSPNNKLSVALKPIKVNGIHYSSDSVWLQTKLI